VSIHDLIDGQVERSTKGAVKAAQPKPIRWDASRKDIDLIHAIGKRVFRELEGYPDDRVTLDMDLTACHCNGCPINFQKLLDAPAFDFAHDIYGIRRHINRETGQLENCFVPRCAKSKAERGQP
jgi:hypothetical protein